MKKTKPSQTGIILKIQGNDKKLTKNQDQFNKLNKKIEKLNFEIKNEHNRLSAILDLFSNQMKPILMENAQKRFRLAKALSETSKRIKFGKKELEKLKIVILDFCEGSMAEMGFNEEQEEFYNHWSDISYQDLIKEESQQIKDEFSKMMKEEFDFDLDFSPEGFEELRKKFENKKENRASIQSNKKKTKSQIAAENRAKAAEELKNKSIRSIYISLVKVLHPDLEMDEQTKSEKEHLMRQVTLAYEKKDLSTLLKFEIEWLHRETEQLEKLTDDKLKVYISVLKEKVEELIFEKEKIQMNPIFLEIEEYMHLPENRVHTVMMNRMKAAKQRQYQFDGKIKELEKTDNKKKVMDFVKEVLFELQHQKFFSMINRIEMPF